jgi:hypothetical protein
MQVIFQHGIKSCVAFWFLEQISFDVLKFLHFQGSLIYFYTCDTHVITWF